MAKKKRKTAGRPALKKSEKRELELRIRVNKKEKKALQANAKAAGYDSVVVWLRELGLSQ